MGLGTATPETLAEFPTADNELQLWVLATIAFVIFYNNYMVALLLPAFSREFSAPGYLLEWMISGYLISYGVSTLTTTFCAMWFPD
jgi:hypothetical protein